MKPTVIRYKTRPERSEENERLIRRVFRELRAKSPGGVRYMALRLGADAFIHIVEVEADVNPLSGLKTFQGFRSGIRDRCSEAPRTEDATIVGNYRMLTES